MSIFQEAANIHRIKWTTYISRQKEKKTETFVCQCIAIYLTNGISTQSNPIQSELSQILLSCAQFNIYNTSYRKIKAINVN